VLIGTPFIFSGDELTSAQIYARQHAGTYAAYLHRETMRVLTHVSERVAGLLLTGTLVAFGAGRFSSVY
jgi:FHS family L-fucose permease-like MFS transporter